MTKYISMTKTGCVFRVLTLANDKSFRFRKWTCWCLLSHKENSSLKHSQLMKHRPINSLHYWERTWFVTLFLSLTSFTQMTTSTCMTQTRPLTHTVVRIMRLEAKTMLKKSPSVASLFSGKYLKAGDKSWVNEWDLF